MVPGRRISDRWSKGGPGAPVISDPTLGDRDRDDSSCPRRGLGAGLVDLIVGVGSPSSGSHGGTGPGSDRSAASGEASEKSVTYGGGRCSYKYQRPDRGCDHCEGMTLNTMRKMKPLVVRGTDSDN